MGILPLCLQREGKKNTRRGLSLGPFHRNSHKGFVETRLKLLASCETPLTKRGVQGLSGTLSHTREGQAEAEEICQIDSSWVSFAGEALLESNTSIDHVYCSPSLRCVQTAFNILKGKT